MMYEVLLYSILLGLILGGSLKNLWNMELKGFYPGLISFMALAAANGMRRAAFIQEILASQQLDLISGLIYFLAFSVLLLVVWQNRHEHALLLVGLGIALNMIVIFSNGAKMPVDPGLTQTMGLTSRIAYLDAHGFYTLANAQTRFYYLADIIKNPFLTPYIVSIGDFLISGGLFIFVLQQMKVKSIRIFQK
jgi:hypothetical protein